jgi:AsmA protein
MSSKVLRYIGYGAAGVLGIAAVGAVYIVYTFDPNTLKPLISDFVRKEKQRELKFDGDIQLSFWPSVGVTLPKVSLSEHNSAHTFVSVDHAKLSLALMPLLKQQYIISSIEASGVRATLIRHADGTLNIDDLLAKPKEPTPPIQLQIGKINLRDSSILVDDRQWKKRSELKGITLKTGEVTPKLARGVNLTLQLQQNEPKANGSFLLGGDFDFDGDMGLYAARKLLFGFTGQMGPASKLAFELKGDARYSQKADQAEIRDLQLEASGDLPQARDFKLAISANANLQPGNKSFAVDGVSLTAGARLAQGQLDGKLSAPKLQFAEKQLSGEAISLNSTLNGAGHKLNADLHITGFSGGQQQLLARQSKLTLAAEQGGDKLQLKLDSPLQLNLHTLLAQLSALHLQGSLASPRLKPGSVAFDLRGNASVSPKQLQLALAGQLDQSKVKTSLNIADLAKPHYQMAAEADQLLLDRYLAGTPAKAGAADSKQAVPFALDLSPLQGLSASAKIRLGSLQQGQIKLANVDATIDAGGGRVQVAPLNLDLFGGHLAASGSATTSKQPALQLQHTLSNVDIGQLLKTLAKYEQLEGRGTVTSSLTAQGGSLEQLTRTLNGKASIQMRDGAMRGINIGARLREAKNMLSQLKGQQTVQRNNAEKTDFSELGGSLNIVNGVIRNDDLSAKSPLLRLAGNGMVDLPASKIDYLLKASLVASSKGQDGRELMELKALTVPVRLHGPLTAPGYTLDYGSLLLDNTRELEQKTRQKLEQGSQRLEEKTQQKLQHQLNKLFGK